MSGLRRQSADTPNTTNHSNRSHPSTAPDPYALVDIDDADEQTGLLDVAHPHGLNDSSKWVGFEEFEGLPWWRTPSVYWLVWPYLLYALAFGGSIVPRINLIIDLVCKKYFSDRAQGDPSFSFTPVVPGGDNPQCKIPDVQRPVAKFMLVLNVVIGLLSAITAPKLGSLSDRYGRTKLIAISSFGGICNEVVTIFATKFPNTIPYQWLILGGVLEGLAGSFTAGTVLSHSYTSDCTPPSKRGVSIGYLHACLFTGLAVGPLIGGYFVEYTGSLLSVFYVALGFHAFFILFVLLVTPESLSKRKQMVARHKYKEEQQGLRHAGFFARIMGGGKNPLAPLKILLPRGRENGPIRRNLLALAFCDFVILGAAMSAGTIVMLYSELKFGWGNLQTSQFVSTVSFVRVFVLMTVFPLMTWIFRGRPMKKKREKALAAHRQRLLNSTQHVVDENLISDELPPEHMAVLSPETNSGADPYDVWLVRLALMSDMLGALCYFFAQTPAMFYSGGVVTAFGGIGSATIQATVTKHVPTHMVGQLLGAMGLLHAIARVISPLVFNSLYAATVKVFPQAFFLLLLSLYGSALLISFFIRSHVYIPDSQDLRDDSEAVRRPNAAHVTRGTLLDDDALPT